MSDKNENYFATFRARTPNSCFTLLDAPIIRPAHIDDVHGLATIQHARDGISLQQSQERFVREISENRGWEYRLLLVAENNHALIGYGRVIYFDPSSDFPVKIAPTGWYLGGLAVTPAYRRRGVGTQLTQRRLEWISDRSEEAFYFVNEQNQASIALHKKFQFEEVTRDFFYPGVTFTGGAGVLYRKAFDNRNV